MSNYLPTAIQQFIPLYYTYMHIEPDTMNIVYIGVGTKDRAYTTRSTQRSNKEHVQWLRQMETAGYTPDEYVIILDKYRDREQALTEERDLIEEHQPRFNKIGVTPHHWCMTFSPEEVKMIKDLRAEGISYAQIARELGRSATGVWRIANDKSKGYINAK